MSSEKQPELLFKTSIEHLITSAALDLFPPIRVPEADGFVRNDFFGKSKNLYHSYIRKTIGSVQIFRIREPIRLEEIYIESNLFSQEEHYLGASYGSGKSLDYGRRAHHKTNQTIATFEIIQDKNRLMVLGDPGAGKSTLLRAIALSSISSDECLSRLDFNLFPIYIELRKYAEILNEKPDITIFNYFLSIYDNDNFKQVVSHLADNRRAIFLLDALDEVPQKYQQRVINDIARLGDEYSDVKIIVSSRIGHRNRLKLYSIHELADFSVTERNNFIKKWMNATGKSEKATKLISQIDFKSGISEITTNPLMLSLLCILYLQEVTLPERRATVYKKCIHALLKEWDADREFERASSYSKIDDDIKLRMLSEIAVYYSRNSERYFTMNAITHVVQNIISKYEINIAPEDFVKEIFSHHGIIVEAGHDLYGFSHLTFQEFLTARFFVEINEYSELIQNYSKGSSWAEILKLVASETARADLLIDEIVSYAGLSAYEKIEIIGYCLNNQAVLPERIRLSLVSHVKKLAIEVMQLHPYTLVRGESKSKLNREVSPYLTQPIVKNLDLNQMTLIKTVEAKYELTNLLLNLMICRKRHWFRAKLLPEDIDGLHKYEVEILSLLFGDEPIVIIDTLFGFDATYVSALPSSPVSTIYDYIKREDAQPL